MINFWLPILLLMKMFSCAAAYHNDVKFWFLTQYILIFFGIIIFTFWNIICLPHWKPVDIFTISAYILAGESIMELIALKICCVPISKYQFFGLCIIMLGMLIIHIPNEEKETEIAQKGENE